MPLSPSCVLLFIHFRKSKIESESSFETKYYIITIVKKIFRLIWSCLKEVKNSIFNWILNFLIGVARFFVWKNVDFFMDFWLSCGHLNPVVVVTCPDLKTPRLNAYPIRGLESHKCVKYVWTWVCWENGPAHTLW